MLDACKKHDMPHVLHKFQFILVKSNPTLACPIKPSQDTQAKQNRQPVIKESLPLEVISEYVWLMIQIKDQTTHKTPMYWLIIMMRDDPQDSEHDDISRSE